MNPLYIIAAGGMTLFLVLLFQVLVGKRIIKFKGPLHMKVHTWTAYALLVMALGHGFFAAGKLVFGWF
ncbi:MAG: hypothetical protein Q7W30_06435 [Coriobacteriia bacterium]|nr:hypothetical protein [Coriobacteriia bacterium]